MEKKYIPLPLHGVQKRSNQKRPVGSPNQDKDEIINLAENNYKPLHGFAVIDESENQKKLNFVEEFEYITKVATKYQIIGLYDSVDLSWTWVDDFPRKTFKDYSIKFRKSLKQILSKISAKDKSKYEKYLKTGRVENLGEIDFMCGLAHKYLGFDSRLEGLFMPNRIIVCLYDSTSVLENVPKIEYPEYSYALKVIYKYLSTGVMPEDLPEESLLSPCRICSCGNSGKYKCNGCKETRYCSKDCQLKDWDIHKETCNK